MDGPVSRSLFTNKGEPFSRVRLCILFFAALTLIEAGAVLLGSALPPTVFAWFFYMNLLLRILHSSHADAPLLWPIDRLLFGVCLFDRFVYRPRGDGLKRLIASAQSKSVRFAIRNPVRIARMIKRALRIARWLAWGMPLVGLCLGLNDNLQRFLIMRRQRIEREKRKAALSVMRAKLDENTSREEAAKRIQAAYRGRKARMHVHRQKRSAQLRARSAAHKLLRAVRRHRSRLQAQADRRPLLLRPDSSFIWMWKLTVLVVALIDVVETLLAPAEDADHKLSHIELLSTAVDSSCVPRFVDGQRQFLLVGPRSRVGVPLPEYCNAAHLSATPLSMVLVQLIAAGLRFLVALTSTCDVFVEFFTGVISPTTGVLQPKKMADRYFLPPFSLLFNVAVNPALAFANTLLAALAAGAADNPYFLLRLVVTLQPILQHAEAYAASRLRPFCRRHMHLFGRKQEATKNEARELLAARSCAKLAV